MTNDKSGVWGTGENAGANAIADENPVNDCMESGTFYDWRGAGGTSNVAPNASSYPWVGSAIRGLTFFVFFLIRGTVLSCSNYQH